MINLRPATSPDMTYVYATFARSFRELSTHADGLPLGRCSDLLRELVAAGWAVTVAITDVDDELLAGWIVHRAPKRVAWVYTRDLFRGRGVARQLLEHADAAHGAVVTPFLPTRSKRLMSERRLIHRPFEGRAGVQLQGGI